MRNTFKYVCAECGWDGFFNLQEFARRLRPRCRGCGSTRLDPVTGEAVRRIGAHEVLVIEGRERRAEKRLGGIEMVQDRSVDDGEA